MLSGCSRLAHPVSACHSLPMAVSASNPITVMARYNRAANAAFLELLKANPHVVDAERNDWFGSVLKLLTHVLLSDTVWLRRTGAREEPQDPLLGLSFSSVHDPVFADFAAYGAHRAKLDDYIVDRCEGLSPEDLDKAVEYANSGGTAFRQPRGLLLMHMFNHQTHHRGQVAEILDQEGIENNASNLVWYLREGRLGGGS